MVSKYQFTVIGPGAVGAFVTASIIDAGHQVAALGPRGQVSWEFAWKTGENSRLVSAAGGADRSSAAFVCVKAYDLGNALQQHLPAIAPCTPVIILCNGDVRDVIKPLQEQYPRHLWHAGICTFGISTLGPESYCLRSRRGSVICGALAGQEGCTAAEQALLSSQEGWEWSADIIENLQRKWTFNTTINSLCAARRLARNGDLLRDPATLHKVFAEAYDLAARLYRPWRVSDDDLYTEMVALVGLTAENENSMAVDRRLGRRTESDFLAGRACAYDGYPLLRGLHRDLQGSTP